MTRQAVHVFPRSLRPLSGETLAGLLLRMSYRHEQPPQHLARLSGLMLQSRRIHATLAPGHLLELPPVVSAALAHSWRLDPAEVGPLTLRQTFPNYAPLHSPYLGSTRSVAPMVNDGWALIRYSRYCPQCLAGDENPIERELGGAWQAVWRLPLFFTCPRHNRMLESTCPTCGNLAHSGGIHPNHGRWAAGRLVPSPTTVSHPAQCRALDPNRSRPGKPRACGARLDAPRPAIRPAPEFTELQERLLPLCQDHEATGVLSAGSMTTLAHYLVDLRLLMLLFAATWPNVTSVVPSFAHFDTIADHLEQQHTVLSTRGGPDNDYQRGHKFSGGLPTGVSASAAMFALGDTFVNSGHSRALIGELLGSQQLLPTARPRFAHLEPFSSPSLRDALSRHVKIRRRLASARSAYPQRPTRQGRYEPRHVPQRLPLAWLTELSGLRLDSLPAHTLSRDAAVRLVQMSQDIDHIDAYRYLGLHNAASGDIETAIADWLRRTGQESDYRHALGAIADRISDQPKIDYASRRDQLHGWTLPQDDWTSIIVEVKERQTPGGRQSTRWDASRHLAASTYVWALLTQSEPCFNPALPRPGYRSQRHPVLCQVRLVTHADPVRDLRSIDGILRTALDTYSNRMATQLGN